MPYKDAKQAAARNKEYCKRWYAKNRAKKLAQTAANRQTLVDWVVAYKQTRGCAHCGFTNPVALDFHHVDPSTKLGNIGTFSRSGAKNKLLEELEKCIVLCANCHRILHHS